MWRDDPHFVKLKITPKPQICQKCGCQCSQCTAADGLNDSGENLSLDYHHRIEQLEREVREYKECSSRLETQLMEVEATAKNEQARRDDEIVRIKDRYDRLMESHKKLSRLNQTLEDQLLGVVTKYEGEKSHLIKEINISHSKLEEAKQLVIDLEQENKRCKTECSIAVQLLQTRPNDYVAQKLGSLPDDLRERLEHSIPREERLQLEEEIEEKQKKAKPTLTVMPTFPPCAAMFHPPVEEKRPGSGDAAPSDLPPPDGATPKQEQGRVCNRQLARVISSSTLARASADAVEPGPALAQYVCARCRETTVRVERAVQTSSVDAVAAAAAAADECGSGGRHVHRAAMFASSSYVSAGPYSGAILDV